MTGSLKPPRVVHLLASLPFGGLQRQAITLAGAQRSAGLDVSVLGVYQSVAAAALADNEGVHLHMTAGDGFNLPGALMLLRELERLQPDVLHLHGGVLWTNILTLLCKRWPIVAHLHNYPYESRHLRSRANEWLWNRLGDRYIAVSESVRNAFLEQRPQFASRTSVVRNGIRLIQADTGRGDPRTQNAILSFGMATRVDVSKGVMDLVDVMAAVAARLPSARFVIAGDGPAMALVRARAAAAGLQNKLELPGFVEDMDTFWRTLDVALFTPRREPFGLRLIEPVAQGVPVVAFRDGSGSDEVIDRCRGILACSHGDQTAFATLAERLATDEGLRERTIVEGLADLRANFGIEQMERQVRAVYDDVLQRSSTP